LKTSKLDFDPSEDPNFQIQQAGNVTSKNEYCGQNKIKTLQGIN